MSNSTEYIHYHSDTKINIQKKKKKKRKGVGPVVHAKIERNCHKGQGTASLDVYGARQSAWSSSGEGQRATAEVRGRMGWELERWVSQNDFSDSKSVIFLFFSSLLACQTHRSRIGAASEPRRRVSEKRKKRKKRTLARHRNPASRTRSGVRHLHDAKNGVYVQPRLLEEKGTTIGLPSLIRGLYLLTTLIPNRSPSPSSPSVTHKHNPSRWTSLSLLPSSKTLRPLPTPQSHPLPLTQPLT